MSDKYGLIIAADGQRINHARNKLDSRRRNLIVDLDRKPPHMQIVPISGGTAFADDGSYIGRKQEILFRMNHNLGYAPLVQAFFRSTLGAGYGNDVYYLSGSAGTIGDTLTFEADAAEFRIVHNLDAYGFTTGYVSPMPGLPFSVKFYIYSIRSGRKISYGYLFDGLGQPITNN